MIISGFLSLAEDTVAAFSVANSLLRLFTPVSAGPLVMSPLWALGSILLLAVLTGVAASSLAALILAVVALAYVFTEVLGFSIEISAPR
jgi:hypothetical protein